MYMYEYVNLNPGIYVFKSLWFTNIEIKISTIYGLHIQICLYFKTHLQIQMYKRKL